jgi:excisionase family DNA binding protein
VAEAAERLGVSRETVRHWCRTGRLPAKRFGPWWRIQPDDVERLIAEAMGKRTHTEREMVAERALA